MSADYRQKTQEELDEEERVYEKEKSEIESSHDLDFLHKKAEEIFYRYGEEHRYQDTMQDFSFSVVLRQIEKQHNPASLPLLLRLCDDARFEVSLFQESWMEVFYSFSIGDQEECFISEYFKNLHELFPQASGMAISIYSYCISGVKLEIQEKHVLLSRPEALRLLYERFLEVPKGFPSPFGFDDLVSEDIEDLKKLKQYYDQHRMRLVE
jgi:hypothetical protein